MVPGLSGVPWDWVFGALFGASLATVVWAWRLARVYTAHHDTLARAVVIHVHLECLAAYVTDEHDVSETDLSEALERRVWDRLEELGAESSIRSAFDHAGYFK